MKVVKKGSFILILILFFVFVSCDKQGSDGPDGPPETEVSLLLDAVLKDGFSQSIQIKPGRYYRGQRSACAEK